MSVMPLTVGMLMARRRAVRRVLMPRDWLCGWLTWQVCVCGRHDDELLLLALQSGALY